MYEKCLYKDFLRQTILFVSKSLLNFQFFDKICDNYLTQFEKILIKLQFLNEDPQVFKKGNHMVMVILSLKRE